MKVLMINGSPHVKGNTKVALEEMVKIFHEEGIETEILDIGNKDIRGCVACGQCLRVRLSFSIFLSLCFVVFCIRTQITLRLIR